MALLEVSPEDFTVLAEKVSRLAGEYLASLDRSPISPPTSGFGTAALFQEPLPERGQGMEALEAMQQVVAHSRAQNGRFLGYVLGSGEPVSAAAGLLAGVLNQNVTAWRSAPAATTIERTVINWLAEAIGCVGFQGSLMSGGSMANLAAVVMAREARLPANEGGARPGMVYASQEVHMSIPKAVALAGIGRQNLRLIATDDRFRMRADELEHAMEADARAGEKPVMVVATSGTVNTGAIDPLREIAEIARRYGAWLHVDGAYGALAAIARPQAFRGLELADSISLDPHKWLYQSLDCGCLLYRDTKAAQAAFSHTGEYARSLNDDAVEGFAFFEESPELSRSFRALKLWLSLRYHGLQSFRQAIKLDLHHAEMLAEAISQERDLELLAPVELSVVCFRYQGKGARGESLNQLNQSLLRQVNARGRIYLSNAVLGQSFALRACFTNHRTTEADVAAVVEEVLTVAREMSGKGRS